ncbi:hypothetical protein KAR91_36485 [Candidatus Pacearchaeota archaeon]|nr:hypothetical protein [Candidatus Pacearchaeota archaeon]
MSNSMLFYIQLASLLTYIITLFVLYKLLVSSKDATIETLKARIAQLKEKLESEKDTSPDILAQRLSVRIKIYEEEIRKLSKDQQANQDAIKTKQAELAETREDLEVLETQLEEAKEILDEFLCPHCKAPMTIHDYASEVVEHGGRELDVEHEVIIYDCGLEIYDGEIAKLCRKMRKEH